MVWKLTFQNRSISFSSSVRKATAAELCEELADFGPFHLFRPHNDLRFSKKQLGRFPTDEEVAATVAG